MRYNHGNSTNTSDNTININALGIDIKNDNSVLERLKTPCILECYYDKELQCCGSCFRTLEEIAEVGKRKKNENR